MEQRSKDNGPLTISSSKPQRSDFSSVILIFLFLFNVLYHVSKSLLRVQLQQTQESVSKINAIDSILEKCGIGPGVQVSCLTMFSKKSLFA